MIEIFDPTLEPSATPRRTAPRPRTLAGLRVALIDNTKLNSDRLLEKIGARLQSDHGIAGTRRWRKRNASVSVDEAHIEEIRRACDIAIAGVGD